MIRCIPMLLGVIATVLFVDAFANNGAVSAVPDRLRPDAPTSQLGVPVNGLRLEVAARFIAEDDGRGEPRLEQTVIFHNESDATICLDLHEIHDSLVLAHISPSSMVNVRSTVAPWGCRPGPHAEYLVRIPAKDKLQFQWQRYFTSWAIPNGKIEHGQLVDDLERSQVYDLTGTGALTLAYVFRSDGPRNVARQMQEFLMPGEKLWSGRVYSYPVTIQVSKLRPPVEPKAK